MLILTRKLYEIVVVGDHTLVTYMGYHAASGVYTFSIEHESTEQSKVREVQLRVDEIISVSDAKMQVVGRKSGQARIGFSAPSNIRIDRLEVRQK